MHAPQVSDDETLLDIMMADMEGAPPVFQPTNYWANYQNLFLPYLREKGLRDFRSAPNVLPSSVLTSFGATDLIHRPATVNLPRLRSLLLDLRLSKLPTVQSALGRALRAMDKALVTDTIDYDGYRRLRWQFVRDKGLEWGATPLEKLSCSLHGNPEDVFEVMGNTYTSNMLYYYLRYAWASRFIDFDATNLYVELGTGMGKQVEIIHKLHPNTTILMFDIPPQLYVSHQYLSAVFGDDVIGYRETRTASLGDLIAPGKIIMMGNWRFPEIEDLAVDVFWNDSSFQEMEPSVVAEYLKSVNSVAKQVFLMEAMAGKERAAKVGDQGVLEPTTLAHYTDGLSNFDLEARESVVMPDGSVLERMDYCDSVWSRR